MDFQTIKWELKDNSAWVTLNRPEQLNAISDQMLAELYRLFDVVDEDDRVRAVVITGAGKAFCAGFDLKSNAENPRPHLSTAWRKHIDDIVRTFMRIWQSPKPVIAAVNGHAMGGGCELTMVCDFTIASDLARFGEPEIKMNIAPPLLIMPWVVGIKQAKELLMLGEHLTADQAKAIGLVTKVVPHESLHQEVASFVTKLLKTPPHILHLYKHSINKTYEIMGLYHALEYNREIATHVQLLETAEKKLARFQLLFNRGIKAYLEERDKGNI